MGARLETGDDTVGRSLDPTRDPTLPKGSTCGGGAPTPNGRPPTSNHCNGLETWYPSVLPDDVGTSHLLSNLSLHPSGRRCKTRPSTTPTHQRQLNLRRKKTFVPPEETLEVGIYKRKTGSIDTNGDRTPIGRSHSTHLGGVPPGHP